jgi:hypothetical protein
LQYLDPWHPSGPTPTVQCHHGPASCNKEKLHHLFAIKGFVKYTNEEVATWRKFEEMQKMVGEKHGTSAQYVKMSSRQVEQEVQEKMRELMEASRKNFKSNLPAV